eukprot:7121111-Pyramimonas_sp.AAC.1
MFISFSFPPVWCGFRRLISVFVDLGGLPLFDREVGGSPHERSRTGGERRGGGPEYSRGAEAMLHYALPCPSQVPSSHARA